MHDYKMASGGQAAKQKNNNKKIHPQDSPGENLPASHFFFCLLQEKPKMLRLPGKNVCKMFSHSANASSSSCSSGYDIKDIINFHG